MKYLFYTSIMILLLYSVNLHGQNIKVIHKSFADSSSNPKYDFSAIYPELNGMKDIKIQENINARIYSFIKNDIDTFIKDVAEHEKEFKSEDMGSGLEYSDSVLFINENIFSIILQNFSFYAGAAHPNTNYYSMTFDLNTGNLVPFDNLFIKKSNYLKKISSICIKDLKKQAKNFGAEFDEEMLNNGAGPKSENFSNYNITKKGLLITFNRYQVAAYVFGELEVFIPYNKIKDYINPEGILGGFIK